MRQHTFCSNRSNTELKGYMHHIQNHAYALRCKAIPSSPRKIPNVKSGEADPPTFPKAK